MQSSAAETAQIKRATRQNKLENDEKGFALVVVIVIMLLITFLAAQLILNVRTELQVAFNDKSRAGGLALAHAGINLGLFRLIDKPVEYINEDYEMFAEGYQYEVFLKTGYFSYSVVNESGKMDLNKLNEPLLKLFLEYMGLEVEDQDVIIDSLKDWRDSDNLHRVNGAELETYEELTDPYIPRNGEIKDPSEFFLIHGTQSLTGLFKASDVFTVYNKSGLVNFNSLPPLMLDFLTEGDEEKKEAYREAKSLYGNLSREQASVILGDERFDQCKTGLTFSSGNNRFYSIISKGEADLDEETLNARKNGEQEADNARRAIEVNVLFELRGRNVNYYSWQEGRS
ncbi:MAG: general secretion pathway protein GspK [Desulfobulbaceae bacterium]|nr:general secretion pathway protein GspK [Desulfobulbaceae bacterium]